MPSGRVWNSGFAARVNDLRFFRSPIDDRLFALANFCVTFSESESAAVEDLRAWRPFGSAAASAESTSLGLLAVALLFRKARIEPEYSGIRFTSPDFSAGM